MMCNNELMLEIFGIASGLIIIFAFVPYAKEILAKKAKPERASWLIWSVLGAIAFFSQFAKGATYSLWLPAADTTVVFLVFILSIKYGTGGFTRRDAIALIGASIGLILWYFTKDATWALLITILIDMIGTYLTVAKTYEDPSSETMSYWILIGTAGVLAFLAVGGLTPILVLYPIYIALANYAVAVAIIMGKKRKLQKSSI